MSAPAPDSPLPPAPVVLLTCGDPAGIGPEIVAAAWRAAPHDRARLRVVADARTLGAILARRGIAPPPLVAISPDDPRPSTAGEVLVIEPAGSRGEQERIPDAAISAAGGRAAATAVEQAAAAARSGQAAAIVTGPLHKEALHAAGYDVPGHTELLARACGLPDTAASMMLWLPARAGAAGGLGVVHATLHESLRTALERLSTDRIAAAGHRLHHGLAALLGRRPRNAVAALNPHGGEGGLFGDDEPRRVTPAVAQLVAAGVATAVLRAQATAAFFDVRSVRARLGAPVLGAVSMVLDAEAMKRRREGVIAFSASVGAYTLLLVGLAAWLMLRTLAG